MGPAATPGPTTLDWFAPAGALIGLLLGGVWWLAARVWPPGVSAAVVVAADLAATGMLHLDGLVDAADGLLPPMAASRRLEVMADPGAGAFGVGAAGVVLLLRWAALASIRPGILLLGGLWCLSRGSVAVVARLRPYARPRGGLASAFAGSTHWLRLGLGVALGVGLLAAWHPGPGLVAAGAAAGGTALVTLLAERRLGGYTGDVLGACALVAETAGLLAAAARW
jgi:adenosylcobinamide-GDP ribazoletransferase